VVSRKSSKAGGKPLRRLVRWTPELEAVVDGLLALPPKRRQFLITNQRGEPYSKGGWLTQWRRPRDRALKLGLITESFQFRDVRAKNDTESVEEAAAQLGHTNMAVTRRHYRRLPEKVQPLARKG
jgi:integrase